MTASSFDRSLFDEKWYLEKYPDVAAAVAAGQSPSAIAHYVDHGKSEGRSGYKFDREWYLDSYPLAERELQTNRATDPKSHYETIGRYRGYLPNRKAPRPDNPVVTYSRFGGFWTDWTDASDRIQGKLDVGLITRVQAEQLLSFTREGFVIIEGAIPEDLLVRARRDLDKAYLGGFRELLFTCPGLSAENILWNPRMIELPAKALDLHWFSPEIRSLIFAPKITAFLHALFETRALVSHSLALLHGFPQSNRQDSADMPFTLQRNFAASWIALEDAEMDAGGFTYVPGSQGLPDFLYGGRCKSAHEAIRTGLSKDEVGAGAARRDHQLETLFSANGSTERRFQARKGDALIWHADLAQGCKATSTQRSHKTLVPYYCPAQLAPLYFEDRCVTLHEHTGIGHYASSYYNRDRRI